MSPPQEEKGSGVGGGRWVGEKADWKLLSPAVVPFMFSLTWGLDGSEAVGASPREGCGSGLQPP